MNPVSRIIGAKPPFPTYDGEICSHNSIMAGPAAEVTAPTA